MQIKEAELFRYDRPFLTKRRRGILLKLTSSSGRVAWGEASPLNGFSQEKLEDVEAEIQNLLPKLKKPSSLQTSSPSIAFALSSALNDLKDPIDLPPIPINAMVFIKQLEELKKSSASVIKIKVGAVKVERAAELIHLNRALLKNKKVRIDANQSWSFKDALFFAKACSFLDIDYFEEPFALKGEKATFENFPYPIALDESFREGIKYFHFKPKAIVFKPTLQKFEKHFLKKEIDFIFSSSYESEIGLMQIAKLAIRNSCPLKPMGLSTYSLFKKPLFKEKLTMKNGHLFFPKSWSLMPGEAREFFRMSF